MGAEIGIHGAADIRVDMFQPDNSMGLTIEAAGAKVTYYGMPATLAWSMFDLLRDGKTTFSYGNASIFWLEQEPQAAADLIRRARDETLLMMEAA